MTENYTPCGLGPCSAPGGHSGTCAQASGWATFTDEAKDAAYEAGFAAGRAAAIAEMTDDRESQPAHAPTEDMLNRARTVAQRRFLGQRMFVGTTVDREIAAFVDGAHWATDVLGAVEPTEADVVTAINAYRQARAAHSHMNATVHAVRMRAALAATFASHTASP